jgi:chromosome segregation ATPase
MSRQWAIDEVSCGPEPVDHETIALLQDEITRLEAELSARDAAASPPVGESEPASVPEDWAELRRRVDDLAAELAVRDETIALLMDQARLFEEAEAAKQAEWEQLEQWVQEVERRVEDRDEQGRDLAHELETERRKVEAQRRTAETQQRAGEAQRQALERDIEQLRGTLARVARQHHAVDAAALEALEQDNRRLRDAVVELSATAAVAAEAEALRAQLQAARTELDQVRRELDQVRDDHQRECNEREAALAAERSQLAREMLQRHEDQVNALAPPAGAVDAGLSVDERIRALRQHLREIHDQEEQERQQRRLSTRLSRLWRKTGPTR